MVFEPTFDAITEDATELPDLDPDIAEEQPDAESLAGDATGDDLEPLGEE